MSPQGTQNESSSCPQTKENRVKKARHQRKRATKKTVRSASHWEWMYQTPTLDSGERLLVWLRGFEGLPWKDTCTRFNTEMGLNTRIERLQMKLNRLDKKLTKKSIEEEQKSQESQQSNFIEQLTLQNNGIQDDYFMCQVESLPPARPELPLSPLPELPLLTNIQQQQFTSVDDYCCDYCFEPYGIIPTNPFLPETSIPNQFSLDAQSGICQVHFDSSMSLGTKPTQSVTFFQ